MNNRDRARFYRLQHKQHALELRTTVASLRIQVQRLQLHSQILRGLYLCGVSRGERGRIVTQLESFIANPSRHVVVPSFEMQKMELHKTISYGCSFAPIVEVGCSLTGKHPATALEAVYQYFAGNSVLMDKLMHSTIVYPCIVRFYFTAEGHFSTADVDVDWVGGLLACVGNVRGVTKVAEPLRDLGDPFLVWKKKAQ